MRIVLLRHGETDRNTADLFQGQADLPLNAAGRRQAREAAEALSPGAWAAVYSSPMIRAVQTASYAAEHLRAPHHVLDGLRERHLGDLDGRHRATFGRQHPDALRRLLDDLDHAPAGGETGRAVLSRSARALVDIARAERGSGGAVLVVTHGGVLNLLARALTGRASGHRPLVATCAAACLDVEWPPQGGPHAVLRADGVAARDCEPDVLPRALPGGGPSVALEDLATEAPDAAPAASPTDPDPDTERALLP
ncbi:histidine phosphatase family protein [Streptomyces sp. NPDC085460]|uniref:histidine phosphatase family protein n=1 Tax=Streptomyces sp. NPDC085460 TaxID=3365723 RepID=UPI0037D20844